MAKQKSPSSLLDKILSHDKKGAIVDEYTAIDESNVKFINTGSYIVNAHFSGSILKGVPMGKIVTVCGEPKAGKSYILLNICREVQKAGYFPVYIETEFSHDKNRFVLQGIDTENCQITQPTTMEQLIAIVNPMINEAMKVYNEAERFTDPDKKAAKIAEIPKLCFFLDSRSGLLSQQQLDSFSEGEAKANMGTDIQMYDAFMKSIAINLGKLGWGFIVASHTKIEEVKVQGKTFTKRRPKGGFGQIFMSSAISMMWKKDERDDEDKSKIIGINVTMDIFESRYCKHRPISFFLPNDRPMSPIDGLFEYVTWEICKIGKGKWVEVIDVRNKLIAKKAITAEDTVITDVHLKTLSKADQEFIGDTMMWLNENGYIKGNEKAERSWTLTKKYLGYVPQADKPVGLIPIENPGSPKYIVAHLPGETFTFEEIKENKNGRIFSQSVLEAIDTYVRADFEIGTKSKFDEEPITDGEADFFEEQK